jgi:hypothetical protein
MSLSCLLLACLLSAPQITYDKAIGRNNVKKIVTDTLDEKARRYKADGYTLKYTDDFVSAATDGILTSEVPPEEKAPQVIDRLREGFGRFVDNIVEFGKEKQQKVNRLISLSKDLYNEYMQRPLNLQKCGEVPCNRPPCCRYCAPPPCKQGEEPSACN